MGRGGRGGVWEKNEEKRQAAIHLASMGWKTAEISRELDVHVNNLKRWLHHAGFTESREAPPCL